MNDAVSHRRLVLMYVGILSLALLPLFGASATAAGDSTNVLRRWDFNSLGDREGWTVPPAMKGTVSGGALWIALNPDEGDPSALAKPAYQFVGGRLGAALATSPAGLELPSREVTQVRLRVLNLSPLTDLIVHWKTKEDGWGPAPSGDFPDWGQPQHSRRFALKADLKEWQEVTCYIDGRCEGTIDQLGLLAGQRLSRGDLWIDWIAIRHGVPEVARVKPDVGSAKVMPEISIPGISQAGFSGAFQLLDDNVISDVPDRGFNFPYITPGRIYAKGGWWLMETSVAAQSAQWTNQHFAEDVMRGFCDLQAANPDGRIDMSGLNSVVGQVGDLSMIPFLFEAADSVARRTDDAALRRQIYECMRRYLDWWLSPVKRDQRTGLISALGEESFGQEAMFDPMRIAPVDTNVAVAVGLDRTATLAEALGESADAERYRQALVALVKSINNYQWDDQSGAYYNYDLWENRRSGHLLGSTLLAFRLGIAPTNRRDRLLQHLLNPSEFDWGRIPVTSLVMTDSLFQGSKSRDTGDAWRGDVLTILNLPVIAGLEESGRSDLAAELNWATIKAFHGNYFGSLLPATGEGHVLNHFAMTAAQYLEAVIGHLFGMGYDRLQRQITICPHVPKELFGQDITLDRLLLPTGGQLTLRIKQNDEQTGVVSVQIAGVLPEGKLLIRLPAGEKQVCLPVQANVTARFP